MSRLRVFQGSMGSGMTFQIPDYYRFMQEDLVAILTLYMLRKKDMEKCVIS